MRNVSRREFLRGGALSLAGAAVTVTPKPPAPKLAQLRDGEILPSPDFTLLREDPAPYVIGIRPHRKGGVRLELEPQPTRGPRGDKRVIHNYGHGGGGITLSWGCASVVVDLVESVKNLPAAEGAPPLSIAVLGTGVIGLTTATEIHRKWPDVPLTVYAKDLDVKSTTSFLAGGQFEPSGVHAEYVGDAKKQVLATYLRRARDRIVEIQKSGDRLLFGVAERKNYTLDHGILAFDQSTPRDVVPAFRKGLLPFEKLNGPGREYSTWLMNPMILLPKLSADLIAAGVHFEQREFTAVKDVLELPETVIVNCTGLGAKALFADSLVVPKRGHNVVLQKKDPKLFWFFSGGCENNVISYIFCRQDDIVVGGSVQNGNDSTAHTKDDDKTFKTILANATSLFNGAPKDCVP